jgi:hypothetical protein
LAFFQATFVRRWPALDESNTPSDRRNALRTIISAAEGLAWVFRNHVVSIARTVDDLAPLVEMAFAETAVFVSEQGKIVPQARHLSTTALVRLTTNVAQSMVPAIGVDLRVPGWNDLKLSIKIRNRVTHPKIGKDLLVSGHDIEIAKSGFVWLAAMVADVMEHTNRILSDHAALGRELIEELRKGDPDALALLQRVHDERDD